MTTSGRPWPRSARAVAVVAATVAALGLGACAGLPTPAPLDPAAAPATGGVVTAVQADLVRADVAARLAAATAGAGSVDLTAALTGPALAAARFRQPPTADAPDGGGSDGGGSDEPSAGGPSAASSPAASGAAAAPSPTPAASGAPVGEPSPPATAPSPAAAPAAAPADLEPAAVAASELVVSPRLDGWPRWFASVVPGEQPAAAPVLEVLVSYGPREPYLLWGRAHMLPGAPAVEVAPAAAYPPPGAPGGDDAAGDTVDAGPADPASTPAPEEPEPGLRAALEGLVPGYASVVGAGDASPAAAAFEPDVFVAGLRERAAAERRAVAGVAGVIVAAEPFVADDPAAATGEGTGPAGGAGTLLAVRTVEGDVLAVTALETATTTSVRPGAGHVRPGPEVRAATGIDAVDSALTVRSVAVLAFVVPEERGAIRLVAVGEELVGADAR
ncbi:hypothetical protein [Aquipuribacter sp. SD81]|uniref:hypothetical protein n=1 Tax=Aquipuribacter sp. SD81 TaxID=3127703 RepID=UPI00301886E6